MMMPKRRQKGYVQRDQRGVYGKEKVVSVLAAFAGLLRRFNVQLVLLQQMILILVAVFLRRSALQLG